MKTHFMKFEKVSFSRNVKIWTIKLNGHKEIEGTTQSYGNMYRKDDTGKAACMWCHAAGETAPFSTTRPFSLLMRSIQ